MGAPLGLIAVEEGQFPLNIWFPLKYNSPSALLLSVLLGPSPVTQRAIREAPLVVGALMYE